MAIVTLCEENRTLRDPVEITEYLARISIDYEQWTPAHPIEPGQPAEEILAAYKEEIEKLNARGGYVAADVIAINPETPNLDVMLAPSADRQDKAPRRGR